MAELFYQTLSISPSSTSPHRPNFEIIWEENSVGISTLALENWKLNEQAVGKMPLSWQSWLLAVIQTQLQLVGYWQCPHRLKSLQLGSIHTVQFTAFPVIAWNWPEIWPGTGQRFWDLWIDLRYRLHFVSGALTDRSWKCEWWYLPVGSRWYSLGKEWAFLGNPDKSDVSLILGETVFRWIAPQILTRSHTDEIYCIYRQLEKIQSRFQSTWD
jgi:hypothetical protein